MTGQKSHYCLDDDNYPVIDTYIYLRDVYNQRLEDDKMVFHNGSTPWNKGKSGIYSEETIHKISVNNKGKVPWNKGVATSIDIKRKISIGRMGKGIGRRKEHIKKSCEVCHKEFEVYPHKANRSRFCSLKCKWENNTNYVPWNKGGTLSEELKQKLKAAHLGKKLSEEQKEKIRNAITKPRIKSKCPHCGKPIEVLPSILKRVKNVYCSKECAYVAENRRKLISGERSPNWKGGISFLPYCQKFNNRLREKIRDRDNRMCQLCGAKENGRKLDVHHIHYDKTNCSPDLIALCVGCHAKVNLNRDYWETHFIEKLRLRGLLL